MSEESTVVTDVNDIPGETVVPAVTYRVATQDDIGNAELKFYKKKADADVPVPEDPSTPVDAATVTAENVLEYVVENTAAVVKSVSDESGSAVTGVDDVDEDQVSKGIALAKKIKESLGGRRRSKRRHPKKGSRKSKKGGARKSKKGGRSRKNGSKRHANKKH